MIRSLLLLLLLVSCAQIQKISDKADDAFDGLSAPKREGKVFKMAWAKNLDPKYSTGNLPIGSASPLIKDNLVFMGGLDGKMRCYQLEDGRLVWEKDEGQPLNAKASIFQDLVIYGSMEGRVFARNYITGELKYSIDLGSPVESAPVVHAGRMFFHLRDHKVVSLDAATGKVFWAYRRSVPYTTTLQRVSRPLPYKNRIIIGFADGNLVALSMEEGVIVWEQRLTNSVKFVDVDVDPFYFQGKIVAGSAAGDMKFVDPENGVIERSINLSMANTPVKLRNSLVVGTVFGDVAIVDASGEVIKKRNLSKSGISSIEKWKDGLVVATMSQKVFYLDSGSLETLAEFNLGHEQSSVFGYLQESKGYLGLYSSRNRLYIFR